jgi:DNA-binding MarR family transcriptional regulator
MVDTDSLRNIGLLLRSINFDFRQHVDAALKKGGVGLCFGEVSPMLSLRLRPGMNGAQLARHSMVSAQAMNAVLRKLVSKKYIERRTHPESLRADSWYLTDRGTGLLERAKKIFEGATSRMLSELNDNEVKSLELYLSKCAAAIEGGDDRG